MLFELSGTGDGLFLVGREELLEVIGSQSLQFSWFGLAILQQFQVSGLLGGQNKLLEFFRRQ
jgi:hypothetical protein